MIDAKIYKKNDKKKIHQIKSDLLQNRTKVYFEIQKLCVYVNRKLSREIANQMGVVKSKDFCA